jgi:hypothetical protein
MTMRIAGENAASGTPKRGRRRPVSKDSFYIEMELSGRVQRRVVITDPTLTVGDVVAMIRDEKVLNVMDSETSGELQAFGAAGRTFVIGRYSDQIRWTDCAGDVEIPDTAGQPLATVPTSAGGVAP